MIFLRGLLGNAWLWLIVGALATGGAYFKGRADVANKTAAVELKTFKKGIENHDRIEKEVKRLPDAELDRRLDKWMRD